MPTPTASAVLIGRLVLAAGLKAAAKGMKALKSRSTADRPTPSLRVDRESTAVWRRFSTIILAMNARNPDLAQQELLAVGRLTESSKVKLIGYVIFCTRRRIRELTCLQPTPADLSALVAAHVEDYKKVIRDDGVEFYRVLKTIMPGPEKMGPNTLLVFASGALGVLLPAGEAADWLAAVRQDALAWAARTERNDLS